MIIDCFERDLRRSGLPDKWHWKEEPMRVVGFLIGGDIVSCLRLFKRVIEVSQKTKIDVLGIGGLWTVSEHRGKGLAKQCIRYVLSTTEPSLWGAVIAHGKRVPDSIFWQCGFDSLGPSPTKPGNQDLFIRYLSGISIDSQSNWKLIPGDHF